MGLENLIYSAGLFSFIGDSIQKAFVGIMLTIDALIYSFVGRVYELFLAIAKARIFGDQTIQAFTNRIYIILGVVMLFILAYSLLKAIVNPDDLTKGDTSASKIATNIVLSLVLLALLPSIFNFLYKFQDVVMSENIIGKIFFGAEEPEIMNTMDIEITDKDGNIMPVTIDVDKSEVELSIMKGRGYSMSFTVLNAFLNPDNYNIQTKASDYFSNTGLSGGAIGCAVAGGIALVGVVALEILTTPVSFGATAAAIPGTIAAFSGTIGLSCLGGVLAGGTIEIAGYHITAEEFYWNDVKILAASGDLGVITAFRDKIIDGEMQYSPILSTIAGIFLLYVMVSFCLDLGVRAAKLAFFQLIAPIPIVSRIVPGQKKIFDNWLKKTLSTYFEVYIRIIVMMAIMFLIVSIDNIELNKNLGLLGKVIIIMGLIAFARQAPKLIGEMFGVDSGNLKLGIGEKLAAGGAFVAGGALGSMATSAIRNWNSTDGNKFAKFRSAIGGAGSGLVRGGRANLQSKNRADMFKNTGEAIQRTASARTARDARQQHEGGTVGYYMATARQGVADWATGSASEALQADSATYKSWLDAYGQIEGEAEKKSVAGAYKARIEEMRKNAPDINSNASYKDASGAPTAAYFAAMNAHQASIKSMVDQYDKEVQKFALQQYIEAKTTGKGNLATTLFTQQDAIAKRNPTKFHGIDNLDEITSRVTLVRDAAGNIDWTSTNLDAAVGDIESRQKAIKAERGKAEAKLAEEAGKRVPKSGDKK